MEVMWSLAGWAIWYIHWGWGWGGKEKIRMIHGEIIDYQSHRNEPRVLPPFSILPYLPILFAFLEMVFILVVVGMIFDELHGDGEGQSQSDSTLSPVVATLLFICPALLGFVSGIFVLARSYRYRPGARVFAVIGTILCGTVALFPLAAAIFPRYW